MPKPVDTTPYYRKHLAPLVGCRVVAIVIDNTDPTETYTGYHLLDDKTGKTYELIALSDPEGNGPGHLSITPLPADPTP